MIDKRRSFEKVPNHSDDACNLKWNNTKVVLRKQNAYSFFQRAHWLDGGWWECDGGGGGESAPKYYFIFFLEI